MRTKLERETGAAELAAKLAPYGEPPRAPEPSPVDVAGIEERLWSEASHDAPTPRKLDKRVIMRRVKRHDRLAQRHREKAARAQRAGHPGIADSHEARADRHIAEARQLRSQLATEQYLGGADVRADDALRAEIRSKAQELAAAQTQEQEAERAQLQEQLNDQWAQLQALRQDVEQQLTQRIAAETVRVEAAHEREQELALQWQRLSEGDPDATVSALRAVFNGSGPQRLAAYSGQRVGHAPAVTVLGCVDKTAVLVVAVPDQDELIRDQEPTYTQAGSPALRKRSQTRMNDLYVAAMASRVLGAARGAAAAAPGIDWVYCIAIVPVDDAEEWEAVYEGTFAREYLLTEVGGIPSEPEPLTSALDVPEDALWGVVGRTRELGTLDTDEDPALGAVVRQMRRAVRSDEAAAAAGDAAAVRELFSPENDEAELQPEARGEQPDATPEVAGYPELELFLQARENQGRVVLSQTNLLRRFAGTYDDVADLEELLTETGFRLAKPLASTDSGDSVEVTLEDPPLAYELRYRIDHNNDRKATVAILDLLKDLDRKRLTDRARDEILGELDDVELICDEDALNNARLDDKLDVWRAPDPTSAKGH